MKRVIREFTTYDSTYVLTDEYNFSVGLRNQNTFQQYLLRAKNSEGEAQSILMSPTPMLKVGPYIMWKIFTLGYSVDMANLAEGKATKRTEINFSFYSNMVGGDFVYQKNIGDFRLLRVKGFDGVKRSDIHGATFDGLDVNTLTANLYYVFNYKRFSYPAAFSCTSKQQKSCGSWMLGLRYDHREISFNHSRLPDVLLGDRIFDEMKFSEFTYDNISLSGGYAYNWVFAKDWLFSGSLAPAVGFKKARGENLHDGGPWVSMKNINFDAIARLGLVWRNKRWYAGASLVSNLYDYNSDRISFTQANHQFNLYVGFCFHRKK